jgi:diguanylate cyclase (GGDEF)-like protein
VSRGRALLRNERFVDAAPFVIAAVVAEVTLAVPGTLTSDSGAALSALFLVITAVLFFLPKTAPPWTRVLIPLCYAGSALALLLATRDSPSIGIVILLPILWAAMNLEFWGALIVVASVAAVEIVTTFVPRDLSWSERLHAGAAYLIFGVLVAYSVHRLRTRISHSGTERDLRNTEMEAMIAELHASNLSTSILSNLVEMLQFCDLVDEAYEVFDYGARQLFPSGGTLYFLNRTSGELEMKCTWGGVFMSAAFDADLCTSIRREQPHESDADEERCEHLHDVRSRRTLCHPVMIQREAVGLLALTIPDDGTTHTEHLSLQLRQHARLMSDQIAIWMASFALKENLKNLSFRDPLTNLFNRRFMIETLHREMAITKRSHDQTSIIQIDIDHFKRFNDSYGHEVGDSVLCSVADVMLGLFRESDVPCRSGGEEFTLILPRCSWDTANERAIELQRRVAVMNIKMPANHAPPRPPTLSIGIATSPENGLLGEELLRGADAALYLAKSAGRNRIVRATVVEIPA